jgi:hypothetical protein
MKSLFVMMFLILGGLALLALFLPLGCEKDSGVDPTIPSAPEGGVTIAGVAQVQGEPPEAGVVVTIEPVEGGVPTTVLASARQIARLEAAGKVSPSGHIDAASLSAAAGVRVTVTDRRGRYAFHHVEKGEYIVTARAETHLAGVANITVPCAVDEELSTCDVPVVLLPTGVFKGVCTLEGTSNQWGTIVYVAGTSHLAVTDPLGKFRIDFVPLGRHRVTAMHIGYIDHTEAGWLQTEGQSITFPDVMLKRDRNIAPTAITSSSPIVGTILNPVTLQGAGTDPDGAIVLYEWDFEDDGVVDWSSTASGVATHHFVTPGTYHSKLTVTDDDGAIGLALSGPVEILDVHRVYVSAARGSDGNPGTAGAPFATITKALQTAAPLKPAIVFVDNGTYDENLALPSGVSVNGGNDATTWARIPGQYTTVTPNSNGAWANAVSDALISGVEFRSDPASSGASSYAMRVWNSPSLEFVDCRFIAGNGGPGWAGSQGSHGVAGGKGGNGESGACNDENAPGAGGAGGSSSSCAGGRGGAGGSHPGFNGYVGFANACGGAAGGAGGGGGAEGGNGQGGSPGTNGAHGANGSAASSAGYTSLAWWYANTSGSGQSGTSGTGGAGGGGGGGQHDVFVVDGAGNGGGGGGGGGLRGTGGGGGGGGGGSFAVILYNSPVMFEACFFQSGNGGAGGAGGNGGDYGPGGGIGYGAVYCTNEIGAGGNGGAGGWGGCGGGGAGGPGGPSFGVYMISSTPTFTDAEFVIGNAGWGGGGGYQGAPLWVYAPAGPGGLRGNTN